MRGKWFAAGLLAAVSVLAWEGSSRGGDTIRLNGAGNTPTRNLVDDGRGADTVRTWHRGFGYGGWGGWGYRGFGYGGLGWGGLGWGGLGYRGFGYGGLGGWGYRGLGWGGLGLYRPYYGFGLGYGGLGYGLGLGGMGYGLGFGRFGYGLGFGGLGFGGLGFGGLGYGGLFGPCSGAAANVYTLNMRAFTVGSPLPGAAQAPAPGLPPGQPLEDGTFPYDGGPSNPVPNPENASPSSTTPRSVPLEGRAVSLPKAAPKWTYAAYGETARRTTPASDRTYLTRGEQKTRSR